MNCWIVNFLTSCSWLLIFSWLSLIFALREKCLFRVFPDLAHKRGVICPSGLFKVFRVDRLFAYYAKLRERLSTMRARCDLRGSFYLWASDFLTYCSWLLILQSAFFTRSLIIVPLAGLSPVALPRSRPLAETRKLPNEHSRGLT